MAGIAAGLIALLWLLLGHRTNQRDKARTEAAENKQAAEASEAARETESNITSAISQARHENENARRQRNETPEIDRRTGRFGTADRLHDDAQD